MRVSSDGHHTRARGIESRPCRLPRDPVPRCIKSLSVIGVLLICAAEIYAQEEPSEKPVPPHRAALESFTYSGKPAVFPTQQSHAQASRSDLGDNPVQMERVVITTGRLPSYLPPRSVVEKPKSSESHSKFGTGVHVKDFGKVRAYSVTILYIPILIGFSW